MENVHRIAIPLQIMETYKSSTATLKSILSHPSLQREYVESTMEALAEANDDAKEIEQVIRAGGDLAAAEAGIDDSELELELAALTKEVEDEKAYKEQQKLLDDRISAPMGTKVSHGSVHQEGQGVLDNTKVEVSKQVVADL
jgi:charged multivesicular body protein 7